MGTPTRYVSAKGANHFTVIDPLTNPKSTMVARILQLIGMPAIEPTLPKLSKKKIEAELVRRIQSTDRDIVRRAAVALSWASRLSG